MQESSPYRAGTASTHPTPRPHWDNAPHSIVGPIKQMWILAIGLAVVSLVMNGMAVAHLASIARDGSIALLVPLFTAAGAMLDAVIYLGLAWGVRRHSRAAACALLAYYLLGQALLMVLGQRSLLAVLPLTVIVSFVMIRGTLATFAYQRHVAQEKRRPPRTRISDDPLFAPRPVPAPVPAND